MMFPLSLLKLNLSKLDLTNFDLPKLEYTLSHPHPKNKWFLIATLVVFLLALPALVLVNIVTLGYELVPSLQTQFQANDTFPGWWGSNRLPKLLRGRTPPCEPKDLGRGDTFRLFASLFDYTVMSAWDAPVGSSDAQKQKRVEYKGQNFASCTTNSARFDYSLLEDTQTITVGVLCPGSSDYPHYVSMKTTMVFAWLIGKDFIGQYYGPASDSVQILTGDPSDYRNLAFAVLEMISTDSLTIMHGQHLSSPTLSISYMANISIVNEVLKVTTVTAELTYLNGTQLTWPLEANIYYTSIWNLIAVAAHTVNLDLGSAGPENIYLNRSALVHTIAPNLAPTGISPGSWAEQSQAFYYGRLTAPYTTWAETLLAGQRVTLGAVTGLPQNSSMVTTYLCPSYALKPISSFLASVFVGSATMFLSVWAGWIFVTTFIAKRIERPCLECHCPPEGGVNVKQKGPSGSATGHHSHGGATLRVRGPRDNEQADAGCTKCGGVRERPDLTNRFSEVSTDVKDEIAINVLQYQLPTTSEKK